MISVDRRLFIAVDAETAATDADASTEYHIPHVHVSTGLRRVLLLERCHVFHCQNRRFPPLQLFVSISSEIILSFAPFSLNPCAQEDERRLLALLEDDRCARYQVFRDTGLVYITFLQVYLLLPLLNRV